MRGRPKKGCEESGPKRLLDIGAFSSGNGFDDIEGLSKLDRLYRNVMDKRLGTEYQQIKNSISDYSK